MRQDKTQKKFRLSILDKTQKVKRSELSILDETQKSKSLVIVTKPRPEGNKTRPKRTETRFSLVWP